MPSADPDRTRPFLALYVAWHPDYAEGVSIAEALREHFRRKLYENVAGGTGLSVLFRSAPSSDTANVPLEVDLDEAEATAVVVLLDANLAGDAQWQSYLQDLVSRTEKHGLGARVFPVAIDNSTLQVLSIEEQALRWCDWSGPVEDRKRRLIGSLTYEFSRMLRHYLERLRRPTEDAAILDAYLKKVQIFLSHSKHDPDGERIALAVHDRIQNGSGLASFFDVYDIPAGLRFHTVLLHQVRVSAMVAIHTDSYSSREWCRREIIEAKRWQVPLVIANSIRDLDERGFPYLGNVPVVRLEPAGPDRIEFVIDRLLDEVLKDFLWKCRIELAQRIPHDDVVFVPRPPELITLAGLPADIPKPVVVYPDPPLSAEEERLFAAIAPHVQLRSLTEWLAGAVR